jgi:hypothetical protein
MKIKNAAKLLTAVSAAALFITATPEPAKANPVSFYHYTERFSGPVRERFILNMIRNYENTIRRLEPMIERIRHQAWAARIVSNYEWYQTELARYQALRDAPSAVTVVNQTVTTNNFTSQSETPESEVRRIEQVVEETVNESTVNVYLEVTVIYEKTVTVRNMQGIFTVFHYSDGSTQNTVGSRELSRSQNVVQRQETFREFVRSYEIIPEPQQLSSGEYGTPTVNVLTAEEYLSREDVSLSGTDTYEAAVLKMNSRINLDYINRESGLAPYGRNLEVIGAPVAWSRGWTGAGSVLSILDTGIDLDHSEFAGRILATECFTGPCAHGMETVQDNNRFSHGTHVAGIAAAALDGAGTTGVAPDAGLLIGKVAYDNGFYALSSMVEGIAWSVNNGADAINVSGNYNVDPTYRNSVVAVGNGVYRSNDTRGDSRGNFAEDGFSMLRLNTYEEDMATAMANSETVLVMSAGNQGLAYPTFPAHWAIETDSQGDLLLDGRAIIVGNWDIKLDRIASTSNRAGTMCFEFDASGQCLNENRISDWFIMAPGQYIAAPDNTGEYRTNSGTSMAAPAVTGAVGVIHQMWPYMTGDNIVQLLLQTADRDITGYDENIHGQGLLDLATATSPQGVVGIPTTGRVEGARVSLTGGSIALAGGGQISALESMMVVDEFDRNFEFNGNSMIAVADTRTADPVLAARYGFAPDYYFGYAGGTVVNTQVAALNIATDGSASVAMTAGDFTFGVVDESQTFLGNYANSVLMSVDGASTAYVGYNLNVAVNTNVSVFGNASVGVTQLDVNNDSLMQSASTVVSNSATLGIRNQTERGVLGLVASLPVAIVDGEAEFFTPGNVSATGDVEFNSASSSLAAQRREFSLGVFQSYEFADNATIDLNVEQRFNYAGTNQTVTDAGVGVTWRF